MIYRERDTGREFRVIQWATDTTVCLAEWVHHTSLEKFCPWGVNARTPADLDQAIRAADYKWYRVPACSRRGGPHVQAR